MQKCLYLARRITQIPLRRRQTFWWMMVYWRYYEVLCKYLFFFYSWGWKQGYWRSRIKTFVSSCSIVVLNSEYGVTCEQCDSQKYTQGMLLIVRSFNTLISSSYSFNSKGLDFLVLIPLNYRSVWYSSKVPYLSVFDHSHHQHHQGTWNKVIAYFLANESL